MPTKLRPPYVRIPIVTYLAKTNLNRKKKKLSAGNPLTHSPAVRRVPPGRLLIVAKKNKHKQARFVQRTPRGSNKGTRREQARALSHTPTKKKRTSKSATSPDRHPILESLQPLPSPPPLHLAHHPPLLLWHCPKDYATLLRASHVEDWPAG